MSEKKSPSTDGVGLAEELNASDVEQYTPKDTGGNISGESNSSTENQDLSGSETTESNSSQAAPLTEKEQKQALQIAARQQLIMQSVSALPEFIASMVEFKTTVEAKMQQVDVVSAKLGAIIDAYEKRQKEAQGAGGTVAGQQQTPQYASPQVMYGSGGQQAPGAIPGMGIPGMMIGPNGSMVPAPAGGGGGQGGSLTGNPLGDMLAQALVGEVSKGLGGGGTSEAFMKMMMENMTSMMSDSFSLNKEISQAIRRRLAQGVVNDVLGIKADTPTPVTPAGGQTVQATH